MKTVDRADLCQFFGIVLVVGEFVVAVINAYHCVAAVAARIGKHETGDTGGVCLKREHQHVAKEA